MGKELPQTLRTDENSSRGVWALTEEGQKISEVNQEKIKKAVVKKDREERLLKKNEENGSPELQDTTEEIEEFSWQDKLLDILKAIHPDQFERLCQRLLRELGFVNVEVTGKTNDGGIDGKGMIRLGGVLSFNVVFQAKRYQGSVSSSVIRDFKGTMSGRAEKGTYYDNRKFYSRSEKRSTKRWRNTN